MAVGRRILEISWILLKRKVPYRDPVVPYEEVIVRRNAPRWIRALVKFGYVTIEPKTKAATKTTSKTPLAGSKTPKGVKTSRAAEVPKATGQRKKQVKKP